MNCPHCTARIDEATPVDFSQATPQIGDLSVCLYCAQLMEFDDNLIVQKISPEKEREILEHNPRLADYINMVKSLKKEFRIPTYN